MRTAPTTRTTAAACTAVAVVLLIGYPRDEVAPRSSGIAAAPGRAYAEGKALLNAAAGRPFAAQLVAEAEAFSRCAATDDFIEGASSFAEKRKPQFKGH